MKREDSGHPHRERWIDEKANYLSQPGPRPPVSLSQPIGCPLIVSMWISFWGIGQRATVEGLGTMTAEQLCNSLPA
jgi:hypothetical protein